MPGSLVGDLFRRPSGHSVPRYRNGQDVADQPGGLWLVAVDGSQASEGAAASPFGLVGVFAFFAGWIVIGALVAAHLSEPGSDRVVEVVVGAALGPIMFGVAVERMRTRAPRAGTGRHADRGDG